MSTHEWVKRLDLPSKELMILAAEVNELCSLEPGNFDPDVHLAKLHHVIQHIHPHIVPSSRVQINLFDDEKNDKPQTFVGQSTIGSGVFQIPNDSDHTNEPTHFGFRDGIGIGNFIIQKTHMDQGMFALHFNHFMDFDEMAIDPELDRTSYVLTYQEDTLEPLEFSLLVPHRWWLFVTYESVPVWKR